MKVLLPNNDLALWHVNFQGAKGTLYEGENFTLQLRFSNDYVQMASCSQSSPPRSSSSGIFPSTSISTRMASSASPSYMTVHRPLFRVVSRADRHVHLPIGPVDAQQCAEENQAT
jgi:hypothetical protein